MKKLEKEAVLKERMILISAVSFFIFILPYILHLAINGIQPAKVETFGQSTQTILVQMKSHVESIQLETYLVGALARNSETVYDEETLKAIAVILRSNAVCAILEERAVMRDSFYSDEELRILWQDEYKDNMERYREIIVSTEGIVIFYEGEIVEVPFHKISAGTTRDSDIFEEWRPYVCSVESAEDMYADGYYTIMEISDRALGEDFAILTQDRFGYALSVRVNKEEMNGESFRLKYGLPSACFDYDFQDSVYFFYIRGVGHGFGLSMYGADALAKKGWSFAEILEYYYPGIQIRKENRSDVIAFYGEF